MNKAKTIENDIKNFHQHVITHREIFNYEGIWLFLATLGCWSVPGFFLKIVAFLITLGLFAINTDKKLSVIGFLPRDETIKQIREQVNELSVPASSKHKLNERLDKLQQEELMSSSALKKGLPFLLSWGFYGISLLSLIISESHLLENLQTLWRYVLKQN